MAIEEILPQATIPNMANVMGFDQVSTTFSAKRLAAINISDSDVNGDITGEVSE
ncbi:MAG: hypothetical protein KDD59_12690 [Bdellovibrionales bacterium]|nr:hypothetical protein [Bdellovibrionales bacterium]